MEHSDIESGRKLTLEEISEKIVAFFEGCRQVKAGEVGVFRYWQGSFSAEVTPGSVDADVRIASEFFMKRFPDLASVISAHSNVLRTRE